MAKRRVRLDEADLLEIFEKHRAAAGGEIPYNDLVTAMENAGEGGHVLGVVKLVTSKRIPAVVDASHDGQPAVLILGRKA